MSRADYSPDLARALDGFSVPPPRAGLADRIAASVQAPLAAAPRRDRRGAWRMARRVVIGSVAAMAISAGAVASGLLGAAGIDVPVLTAMLAPKPVAKHKAVKPKAQAHATVTKPQNLAEADAPVIADPGSIAPPMPATRIEKAIARRIERRNFIAQNPQLRPVLRDAVRRERDFVAANPEVRNLWRMPLAERRAYLADKPELRAALAARRQERRALVAQNPEIGAFIRAQAEKRRAERQTAQQVPTPAPTMEPEAEGNVQVAR